MKIHELMSILMEFGYTPARRSFGGPFAFISPQGNLVVERDFQKEVDNLIRNLE